MFEVAEGAGVGAATPVVVDSGVRVGAACEDVAGAGGLASSGGAVPLAAALVAAPVEVLVAVGDENGAGTVHAASRLRTTTDIPMPKYVFTGYAS